MSVVIDGVCVSRLHLNKAPLLIPLGSGTGCCPNPGTPERQSKVLVAAVAALFARGIGNPVSRSDELAQLCPTNLDPCILSRSGLHLSAGAEASAI